MTLIGLSSCQDDDIDPIILILSPNNYEINANTGDYVKIGVKVESDVVITKLLIQQTINSGKTEALLDSNIMVKSTRFDYSYLVPQMTDYGKNKILIEVIAINGDGESQKSTKLLIIDNQVEILEEIAGNEMFSRLASNKNAFNLIDIQPLNFLTADSTIRHIEDYSLDTGLVSVDTLSRRWVSPAEIRFVKYNSFDYANATNESLKNSFLSGIKTDFIDDLKAGDIILVYLPNAEVGHEYYALKIVYILDPTGVENDKYIFNIKH